MYPFIGEGLISGSGMNFFIVVAAYRYTKHCIKKKILGKLWKAHRKMLTYVINQRILDNFIESFDRHSKYMVEKLKPLANGEIFDVFKIVESCTIDIVCGMYVRKSYKTKFK